MNTEHWSNNEMNEVFERLVKIKMVDPNENLYDQILIKIQNQNIINLFWVKAAACLLIIFITTELYFATKYVGTKNKIENIEIYKKNNFLYYE